MELPTYFEALMNRAPIPSADVGTFLREMRRTPQGPLITSKLIANKIQSPSEALAINAFEFLETALDCETEGSIEFRTEIGRYRFLNEIIRILSPKYLGDQTAPAVKERAKRFLNDAAGHKRPRWFPSEHSKICCVYNSLIETGIIPKPADDSSGVDAAEAELQKSIFDRAENAAILKKLLTSKDPADLQAANRLIKNLVEEEAKRNERRAELHSLIDRIDTSTSLLTEMLSQPMIDEELVDDLATTCQNLRQKLGGCATETTDETTSVLQASENIEKVINLYQDRKDNVNTVHVDLLNSPSGDRNELVQRPILSLADELLIGLSDEFAAPPVQPHTGSDKSDNLLNLEIEINSDVQEDLKYKNNADNGSSKAKTADPLGEIERLSREMMEQSLKNSKSSVAFGSKKTDKATLSQLQRNSSSESSSNGTSFPPENSLSEPTLSSPINFLDLEFLEKSKINENTSIETKLGEAISSPNARKTPRTSTSNEDEILLPLETQSSANPSNVKTPARANSFNPNTVKEVDLENLDLYNDSKPIELPLVCEDNDGNGKKCQDVNVTVTLGRAPEFPDTVLVAVVTLANRSKSAELLNYVFQMVPPKGMQVKLLAPSCMELPSWKKTFLPPPVLTQVALLVSNQKTFTVEKTKMKFILSYCLGEETALHNGHFELPPVKGL